MDAGGDGRFYDRVGRPSALPVRARMNDTAQIIVAVATLVTAMGSFVMSWVNRGTIKSVQAQTNGMIAKIEAASEAKGNLQGRYDEKQDRLSNRAADEPAKAGIKKIPPLPKA